jgi:hypothetical protein
MSCTRTIGLPKLFVPGHPLRAEAEGGADAEPIEARVHDGDIRGVIEAMGREGVSLTRKRALAFEGARAADATTAGAVPAKMTS